MISLHSQSCSECGQTFKGRADKRFCTDQCRANYHNRLRRNQQDYVSSINKVLKNNRKILSYLNPKGKIRVSKDILISKGFDFRFFTCVHTTKEGSQYFYCYEQGYHAIEKDHYLLVVKFHKH